MNINKLINQPVEYYLNMKGKNIRNELCNFLGTIFNINIEDIESINDTINIIHNASLVIDDIEDNSLLRRSNDCAHIKYGIPLSINSGYMSIFKVLSDFNKQDNILMPTRLSQKNDRAFRKNRPRSCPTRLQIEFQRTRL